MTFRHAESVFIVGEVLGILLVSWDHHIWNLGCNVLDLIHEIVTLRSVILTMTH